MPQYPQRPRVLLADDDERICAAVSRLLAVACDVVGCASDSAALFDATAQLRPDVVVLDFSLPGGASGLETCRLLKAAAPQVSVVAFTAHDDEDLRRLIREAGASAYVSKLRAATDLLPTIQAEVARMALSTEHNR